VGGEYDYVEYDVDLANEYLDKVLPEKDADGFRLGPDGKVYTMINVVVDEATRMDMSEMLQRYWEQVGIKTEIRAFTRDAADQMYANRDFDIRLWGGGNGLDPTTQLSPWSAASPGLQGAGIYEESYGVGWSYWIRDQIDGTNNELSVEPPENWKTQYELVATALQTVDVAERTELFKQAFQIFVDDFVMIGVSLPPPSFRIAQKDLRNVYQGSFGWPEGLERPLKVWAAYYAT
jgi:peptide/nickel transport system substrate-binding protein